MSVVDKGLSMSVLSHILKKDTSIFAYPNNDVC